MACIAKGLLHASPLKRMACATFAPRATLLFGRQASNSDPDAFCKFLVIATASVWLDPASLGC